MVGYKRRFIVKNRYIIGLFLLCSGIAMSSQGDSFDRSGGIDQKIAHLEVKLEQLKKAKKLLEQQSQKEKELQRLLQSLNDPEMMAAIIQYLQQGNRFGEMPGAINNVPFDVTQFEKPRNKVAPGEFERLVGARYPNEQEFNEKKFEELLDSFVQK